MFRKTELIAFFFTSLFSLFIFSGCNSTKNTASNFCEENKNEDEFISIVFGGDIMAHRPNYAMKDYSLIWEDIKDFLHEGDLALANLEAPVDDKKPFETYPTFNMNSSYVQAAIDAGFNIFSLANNHTNDQKLEGILETYKYFIQKEEETKYSERPVYACGIKNISKAPLTYRLINIKNWKILFCAVTEILNKPYYSSYIDFFSPGPKGRTLLKEKIKLLKEKNPCDIFILSLHASDEEYIQSIREEQKNFYNELLECGVDIVWANHAHVAKDWELLEYQNTDTSKMIFHALGNIISAQRYKPNFKNPSENREYTGDGYLIKVLFKKTQNGIKVEQITPLLITTYITPEYNFVIKKLNDETINKFKEEENIKWASFLTERKKLMENTKGNIRCQ